jgi:ornithine cyclodeaminase
MTTPIFDAAATAALLPYAPLAEAVAETLSRKARGLVACPPRLSLPLPDGGVLLVMPASDGETAVTKLITVCPANPGKGLPLIMGEVVAMRASTGERLGILDGPEVTARRTAAASLLAAQRLAVSPEGPLLVMGAGVQALSHVMAFCTGLGVGEVYVCSRSRQKSEALADRLRSVGVRAQAVARPEEVLERATLIVTATNSPEPVIPAGVRGDVFIAAVGSFHADRAEIPAELVRRCRLYVDDLEAARTEAGDIILAGADWDAVTPLERTGERGGERGGHLAPQGPVLYKGVGCAALDLAAAKLAFPESA